MNDYRTVLTRVSAALLVAAPFAARDPLAQTSTVAQAPAIACSAIDSQCLESRRVEACTGEFDAYAACLALVTSLRAHAFADEPEWRLMAASIHLDLADLAEHADTKAAHERAARDELQSVVERWPVGRQASDAYTGLAVLAAISDDADGHIGYLRQAVAADPRNRPALTALARALNSRRRDRDLQEAADLYREASRLASGNHRWYLAGNAHALYLATGQEREAQAYEEQIARESGMAYFADEIESERFRSDPGQQERVLTTACSSYIVSLFGDDTCLRAMRVVFEAVESADGQLRTAMQTAAAKGMQELLPYEEQHRPEMRSVLQAWFDAGMTSAEALATLAHMDRERYDRSLTAE